jgi:hypothetical protein
MASTSLWPVRDEYIGQPPSSKCFSHPFRSLLSSQSPANVAAYSSCWLQHSKRPPTSHHIPFTGATIRGTSHLKISRKDANKRLLELPLCQGLRVPEGSYKVISSITLTNVLIHNTFRPALQLDLQTSTLFLLASPSSLWSSSIFHHGHLQPHSLIQPWHLAYMVSHIHLPPSSTLTNLHQNITSMDNINTSQHQNIITSHQGLVHLPAFDNHHSRSTPSTSTMSVFTSTNIHRVTPRSINTVSASTSTSLHAKCRLL